MVIFKQERTYFMETVKIDFINLFWYYFLKFYVFIYQVSSITKKKHPRTNPVVNFFKSACSFSYGDKTKLPNFFIHLHKEKKNVQQFINKIKS